MEMNGILACLSPQFTPIPRPVTDDVSRVKKERGNGEGSVLRTVSNDSSSAKAKGGSKLHSGRNSIAADRETRRTELVNTGRDVITLFVLKKNVLTPCTEYIKRH